MRELAEAVGIEPASIYSHYNSKEMMLWHIAKRCARDFLDSVEIVIARGHSLDQQLEQMITTHVEVTIRNQDAAAVFDTEWQHLGQEKKLEYAAMRDKYEGYFRSTLQKGAETGIFREVDPKFSALTILSAVNFTYKWYKPSGGLTPTEIGQELASTLLKGILTK